MLAAKELSTGLSLSARFRQATRNTSVKPANMITTGNPIGRIGT